MPSGWSVAKNKQYLERHEQNGWTHIKQKIIKSQANRPDFKGTETPSAINYYSNMQSWKKTGFVS